MISKEELCSLHQVSAQGLCTRALQGLSAQISSRGLLARPLDKVSRRGLFARPPRHYLYKTSHG